jgi:ubiquinone/menaquinone biosynthesis C-methylase UbiE
MIILTRWRSEFDRRQRYAASSREPFFELAAAYLPVGEDGIVVDIGAGDGSFARSQNLVLRYKNLYLLDHNTESVAALKKEFPKAEVYSAPEKLPFDDKTVSFIHLSHIVEHLESRQLYTFLGECDRVLADGGVLVISAPLLWDRFYDDLSHVKPYAPAVFINYLCAKRANANAEAVSDSYHVQELVYRFRAAPAEDGWGSRFFVVDAVLRVSRVIISALGFRRYLRNGFTLVLKKS